MPWSYSLRMCRRRPSIASFYYSRRSGKKEERQEGSDRQNTPPRGREFGRFHSLRKTVPDTCCYLRAGQRSQLWNRIRRGHCSATEGGRVETLRRVAVWVAALYWAGVLALHVAVVIG